MKLSILKRRGGDIKTSIIDVPRRGKTTEDPHRDPDLLGIECYEKALVEFILNADTPITIALQGEWGSGKTSLMNTLKAELVDKPDAKFNGVWINTWQYALMSSPEDSILEILKGITAQIGLKVPSEKKAGFSERFSPLFKRMVKVGTIVALNTVSGGGKAGDEVAKEFTLENATKDSDIATLKAEIAKLIVDALGTKNGFLFFIDDLDRIDPPIAVQILELLKNIFDLKHCIFILSIDYDVVIKGLKPKFGELTDRNEREFRSFFDKIIQLPFAMPVASYQIDKFLCDALKGIGFLSDEEEANVTLRQNLSEFARLSVGTNPRSLKRLTNILSLIHLIMVSKNKGDKEQENVNLTMQMIDKQINFALVCIQINYPAIYNTLLQEPDFKKWDESFARKLSLKVLTETEIENLDKSVEFDEEWEKVLYQLCTVDYYLKNRVHDISKLLNRIAELIPQVESLEDTIRNLIQLSAVTNLQTSAQAVVTKPEPINQSQWLKRHRDALVPKMTTLFGSKGKFWTQQTRVQSKLEYRIELKSDGFNRDGLMFSIESSGKQYAACMHVGYALLSGAASNDIEQELERIGKAGAVASVESELTQLKEMDGIKLTFSNQVGNGSIYFQVWYDSLEDMVSEVGITKYSEILTKVLNLLIQLHECERASTYGVFNSVLKYYQTRDVKPFTHVWVYDKHAVVIDTFTVKGSSLALDVAFEKEGWCVMFFNRKANQALLEKVRNKAQLERCFPFKAPQLPERYWPGKHIPFNEVQPFVDDVIAKLNAIDWSTVEL